MSHFNIFQLSKKPIERENYITENNILEDELVQERSDYPDGEENDTAGAFRLLANEMKAIADVDEKARTITFKCRSAVRREYNRHLRACFRKHMDDLKKGECSYWLFHRSIEDVCFIRCLFHIGWCHTPSSIVEDYLNGNLPRTLHVGAILKAHC